MSSTSMTELAEPTSMTTATSSSTASSTNASPVQSSRLARQFDLKIARDAFVNCVQSENALLLCEYVRAYEELCV